MIFTNNYRYFTNKIAMIFLYDFCQTVYVATYCIIEEINDSWKIIIRRRVENEFAIYMLF